MTDVQYIESIRSQWLAALDADAANPKPDYSIDGQTVSRSQWRSAMLEGITRLGNIQQLLEPFELKGFTL